MPRKEYEAQHRYYLKNRVTHIARSIAWQRANPLRKAMYARLWRLGVTFTQFFTQWAVQGGNCAICGDALSLVGKHSRGACQDHNHNTKQLRGILCNDCNLGLSKFNENPERLAEAIRYLREWSVE